MTNAFLPLTTRLKEHIHKADVLMRQTNGENVSQQLNVSSKPWCESGNLHYFHSLGRGDDSELHIEKYEP